ncbi:hypothetical protein JOM56_000893 [Amanita muscaria]
MVRIRRSQSTASITPSQTSNGSGNRRLSDKQKLEQVLQLLSQFRWTLSTLLLVLFRLEKPGANGEPLPVERSVLHQRMVTAMLDGTTATHFGEILEMIYHNAQRTSYRRDDDTRPSKGLFSTTHTAAKFNRAAVNYSLDAWLKNKANVGERIGVEATRQICDDRSNIWLLRRQAHAVKAFALELCKRGSNSNASNVGRQPLVQTANLMVGNSKIAAPRHKHMRFIDTKQYKVLLKHLVT